jgi:histidinol-phosphate aminotransferase
MNNPYYKKKWLQNVDRVHPPREEQLVDDKLRLHRAERIEPFTDVFFENFMKTVKQEDFRYYPDIHILKEKLANMYGFQKHNIFLNNGSSENIKVFYEAFAMSNQDVIITKPSYPMHKIYADLNNSNVVYINYNKELQVKYKDFLEAITDNTCCVVIANPNSPIGDIIGRSEIEEIIKKTYNLNIPILIDEAYIEYSKQESCINLIKKYNNLVVSRTFSKALGCAGLRIGYLVGGDEIMEVINKFIPTYEVSSISAKFGLYILENYSVVDDYIKLIHKEKELIKKICLDKKITVLLNHINTIHFKVNNVEEIKEYLDTQPVFYRTRKLPHDESHWLAVVLYPGFSESEIMGKIIESSFPGGLEG